MRCRSVGCGTAERDRQCDRVCDAPLRSHNAVIRVYDVAGNVIETHVHAGDFKEP
jgi:hypothetical protein